MKLTKPQSALLARIEAVAPMGYNLQKFNRRGNLVRTSDARMAEVLQKHGLVIFHGHRSERTSLTQSGFDQLRVDLFLEGGR